MVRQPSSRTQFEGTRADPEVVHTYACRRSALSWVNNTAGTQHRRPSAPLVLDAQKAVHLKAKGMTQLQGHRYPKPQGLYDPANEHDSCGVAFVVDMHGRRSRDIVDKAITALVNLEHRGATGAEPNTGDGAGILLQVPDKFFRAVVDFDLPEEGSYVTGIAFLPQARAEAAKAAIGVEQIVSEEGLAVIGWREVPIDESSLGALTRDAMPTFRQVFIGQRAGTRSPITGMDLERRAYVIRKRAERELGTDGAGRGAAGSETVYFPSLSGKTFVYKGMLTTPQLKAFYLDLQDDRLESALGLVHSRFSHEHLPVVATGAPVPSRRAQRRDQHGHRQRELDACPRGLIESNVFGDGSLDKIFPVCTPGASDTARFDEVLGCCTSAGATCPMRY